MNNPALSPLGSVARSSRPRPALAAGLALAAAALAARRASAVRVASASSKLLWSVSDANSIYGSAGVARNRGGATFAVGTDSGSAQYADVVTQAGKVAFRITPSDGCNGACSLYVSQARHVGAASDPGAPAVDTFVLQVGDGNCTVFGFVSAGGGATGAPSWTAAVENCDAGEGVGGTYRCFEASDDGSLVVLSGFAKMGGDVPQARAFAFEGQSGAKRWEYDLKTEVAGQGDIWLTEPAGAFVAFINEDSNPTPNSAQMHVLLGATGELRQEVQMPFFIAGDISDDGNYIAIQNVRRGRRVRNALARGACARRVRARARGACERVRAARASARGARASACANLTFSRLSATRPPCAVHAPRRKRGLDPQVERHELRPAAPPHAAA